ncbi:MULTISPECIES: DUF5343 domain-containing protein [unclassified Microbacterium]|uniref:DUF5343 domain-containing protein n=1 Tax=unclassified Microbacterium TaxID=2609290 RepID=UPI0038639464
MASYPYTSGQGALVKAFDQFRKAFPPVLDASTLKRFGIAPANESYVINIFRFLGLIDDDGKKVDATTEIFFHGEESFKSGLEGLVSAAYADLFAEHGANAWDEGKDSLTTWFRVKDKTSELIGGRQASTFLTLAALAGHGEPIKPAPTTKTAASKPAPKPKPKSTGSSAANSVATTPAEESPLTLPDKRNIPAANGSVGLSVRVEVNLPAAATPEVYDAIFASIRKNLIDRE